MILKGKFIRLICDLEKHNDNGCSKNLLVGIQDYTGITYKECFENAKSDGWEIKGEKILCPYHKLKELK